MNYTLRICDDDENIIAIIDNSLISRLEWQITENEIGTLTCSMPMVWDWNTFQPYRTVILERNGAIVEGRRWFLLDWAFYRDEAQNPWVDITCYDSNVLLDGYTIAYNQGSSQAEKTDQADDLCKLYVTENIASPTDTTRAISGITSAAGTGSAPTDTVSVARQSVLRACQDAADSAWKQGTYLVFDLVNTGPGTFELRTYINQHGVDHTASGSDPRVVTLKQPRMEQRWSESRNYIYCGGQGTKSQRILKTATNSAWTGVSKYARRELFVNASRANTANAVQAQAYSALQKNRPRVILTGIIDDSTGMIYGVDYGWGDKVTCAPFGIAIDCRISSVGARYDAGKETLETAVRGEL